MFLCSVSTGNTLKKIALLELLSIFSKTVALNAKQMRGRQYIFILRVDDRTNIILMEVIQRNIREGTCKLSDGLLT
ncbi:hypothetical protein HZS_8124 [Henneguya salminicola]|nr:hypothetical protein HZS_8124 [Henneguya salminicola]